MGAPNIYVSDFLLLVKTNNQFWTKTPNQWTSASGTPVTHEHVLAILIHQYKLTQLIVCSHLSKA